MSGKTLVQNTNISCVVSKWSTSERGYFVDPFIKFLTGKLQKRSPLINRGYYIRAQAIVQNLHKALSKVLGIKCQIVSLGAGFDTTFFRLKSEELWPTDCRYYEIDFKSVLEQKCEYIRQHSNLLKLVGNIHSKDNNNIVLTSDQLILVGGDLYNLQDLEVTLLDAELNFTVPTIFLSECVLNYMQTNRADDIIKWAAGKFPNALFIMYEQICPCDGFGHVMKDHFSRIGSPLLSIDSYPDVQAQKQRFIKLGWQEVVVEDLNTISKNLGEAEHLRVSNLEPFDEFEEFHMKCSHYILATARNGFFQDHISLPPGSTYWPVTSAEVKVSWEVISCPAVSRFGHAAAQMSKSEVLLSGGFGHHETGHKRLTDLKLVNFHTGQENAVILDDPNNFLGERLFHRLVLLSCKNCLLVVGGRSSPGKALSNPTTLLLKRQDKFNFSDSFEDVCSQHSHVFSKDDTTNFSKMDTTHLDSCPDRRNRYNLDYSSSQLKVLKLKATGESPEHLWRHSATHFVNDKGEEKILVFGGYNHRRETSGDCYLLDLQTLHWSKQHLSEVSPSPRHSHSCVLWNDSILLSGGLSDKQEALCDLHIFNTKTETWSQCNLNNSFIPRYSHTSHMWKDSLYLIGGVTTSCIPNGSPGIAIICLKTKEVMEHCLKPSPSAQPVLLFKHTSFLKEDDGSIWILGGGGNCFSFGTAFNRKIIKLEIK